MAHWEPNKNLTDGTEPWRPRGARGVPFAPWFSFSSKSPFHYDAWNKSEQRPYQIVLMPGYTAPERSAALAKDCDMIWYEKPVKKPTIVWDGFGLPALFEIRYEAFRADLVGEEFVKIRDVVNNRWVNDPRSAELLAKRPKRGFVLPDPVVNPAAYQLAMRDHRRRLSKWVYESMATKTRDCQARGEEPSNNDEVCFWSLLSCHYSAALRPHCTSGHPDAAVRTARGEKRASKTRTAFMDAPDYHSALSFSDMLVEKEARRHFSGASLENKAAAEKRIEQRRQAVKAIPHHAHVETRGQKSFWGKLFSF